jgi:hypothetical protein
VKPVNGKRSSIPKTAKITIHYGEDLPSKFLRRTSPLIVIKTMEGVEYVGKPVVKGDKNPDFNQTFEVVMPEGFAKIRIYDGQQAVHKELAYGRLDINSRRWDGDLELFESAGANHTGMDIPHGKLHVSYEAMAEDDSLCRGFCNQGFYKPEFHSPTRSSKRGSLHMPVPKTPGRA